MSVPQPFNEPMARRGLREPEGQGVRWSEGGLLRRSDCLVSGLLGLLRSLGNLLLGALGTAKKFFALQGARGYTARHHRQA
jgi:hypothetical protein